MAKKALITGITGQDGSYLCEFLLAKGYEIHGLIRRSSSFNTARIESMYQDPHIKNTRMFLHYGDLTDGASLVQLIKTITPDEIYNLAAQSVHEDSIIPILNARKGYAYHMRIKDLWGDQITGGKIVRVEKVDGIDVEVIDIKQHSGTPHVLGYWNGMGTFFPIKQISRHRYTGKLADMRQKWGRIIVTPNHSIYDSRAQLCKPNDNPELLCMRKLNYSNYSQREMFDFADCIKLLSIKKSIRTSNGYATYIGEPNKSIKRVLSGDDLLNFMKFVGAYVAEGFSSYNTANKKCVVGICNCDKEWLESLRDDLADLFHVPTCITKHKKKKEHHRDSYQLEFASRLLYEICKKLFGEDSGTKKLFDGVFSYPEGCLRTLLEYAVFGDGSIVSRKRSDTIRYTTTSDMLAAQMCFLYDLLRIDYSFSCSSFSNEKWADKYEIRECTYYQPHQGVDDRKIEWVDYDGYVYDISVDEVNNFIIGTGNVVVHNSHVRVSFDIPVYTVETDAIGALQLLEAIRSVGNGAKFYQASSSEMFGKVVESPQTEKTPFYPRSPYACAKVFSYWQTINYREAYDMFACNGILYNHESPRRGETFVTRKITRAATRIKEGLQEKLFLGNLDAKRDWGFAGDYVEAMWLMLQQDEPGDFIIATGETRSVREFVEEVFGLLGLDWQKYVEIDPRYFRPTEVDLLLGDFSKAKAKLSWKPTVGFKELVKMMVESDWRIAREEKTIADHRLVESRQK